MYTQNGLDSLFIYCQRWKLKINDMKTKMFSEKVASWHGICTLHLTGNVLKQQSFSYLGVVFSSGGSFNITEGTLAGKAQKLFLN